MFKLSRKPTGLQVLLLSFGLAALALTILRFSVTWRSLLNWSWRGWALEIGALAIYWPQTTIWLVRFPRCILQPISWPPIVCARYLSSPFPYAHLVIHGGATALAVLFAHAQRRSMWVWGALSLLFPEFTPIVLALLKPKPVGKKKAPTTVCARCGQEREKGQHYAFHYGELLSSRGMIDLPYLTTRNTYRIVGTERAWVCRTCLIERVLLTLGLGVILLTGLPFGLNDAEGTLGVITKLVGLASLAGLFLLWAGLSEIGVLGERLAIKARKAKLEAAGFDGFFDHRQAKRLTPSRGE